jgi:hypothetical protein
VGKETQPEKIERTGENSMVVTHDDGSKFDCNFNGNFPSKRNIDGVKSSKCLGSGDGPGSGSIKKMRDKLGLNDHLYNDPESPYYKGDKEEKE